jgi:hypothetical protein
VAKELGLKPGKVDNKMLAGRQAARIVFEDSVEELRGGARVDD